jgi:hypothetical protein
MINLLISINWVLGVCFFAIAILFPVLDQKFLSGGKKVVAEQVVDRISRLEQRNFQLQESYIFFAGGQMPPSIRDEIGLSSTEATDFVYEVYQGKNREAFIIKARVSDKLIKQSTLPPLVYTYTRDPESNISKGSWGRLSGKTAGLF